MKLILLKDVETLGREGDVVEVSDGHARNFLLPQNLAVPATKDVLHKRDEREKKVVREKHKELSVAGDLAHRLEGNEVVLSEKSVKEESCLGR